MRDGNGFEVPVVGACPEPDHAVVFPVDVVCVGRDRVLPCRRVLSRQQFGIGVLQSQGLLPGVAKGGLEYPIDSDSFVPFSTVLQIHRTDTNLANQILADYAGALGIATPEVVAALNEACPTAE